MLNFLKMLLTPEFFFSIIRISAPILFATLAAIVVEKAGFCNIGLEGLMMFSALTGSLVSYYAHSWVWGLLAALAIGVLMSLMMGFFAFQLKTDITLVGIAVNMMGSGGTLFLCKVITNLTEGTAMASSTGLINSNLLIPSINLPLISKIPFLGGILSGHQYSHRSHDNQGVDGASQDPFISSLIFFSAKLCRELLHGWKLAWLHCFTFHLSKPLRLPGSFLGGLPDLPAVWLLWQQSVSNRHPLPRVLFRCMPAPPA